ncbi:MAG: SDR family NAD(P)-dependent oxidoreductase [Proteobacteria bacterium]|nr:SDR family NAD(P)-dependent oxidoreductase [Pseudomonadota bacterium]
MSSERPQVALVTGASRGAGKGIALALGAAGMTVYVTGRSREASLGRLRDVVLPGTVLETAAQVSALGGRGVALPCDHRDDGAVEQVLRRIAEESGRLDILVNNAAAIHDALIDPGGFWEKPLGLADIIEVGLRSAYVASYFAAPMMVAARRGLIAFTSSFGASCYMHGPAYGAQKVGLDKFAADMAVDLQPHKVASISLWLGPQLTERTAAAGRSRPDQYEAFLRTGETPQFNGRIIHALASDPELMSLSGQTLISAEAARRYGITEEGGREPPSYREMLGAPRMPHPAKVM